MNKITGVTRRDIFDLFRKGITEDNWLITENIFYPYYGRFDIVEFLKRLYNLADWESRDSRVDNAEEEIIMHIHNGDYPDDWIFEDERFQLFDGEDNILLNFICEVFHPEVRDENGVWERYLERINALLKEDGYEIVATSKLSGRDVFSWRTYIKKPSMYIPFSERNKSLITGKKNSIKLPNAARHQLFKVMNEYNETFMFTSETNFNYYKSINDLVLEDITKFYIPKHYVGSELVEINEFSDFKEGTRPFTVFDVIESFNRHTTKSSQFRNEINAIFKLNNINVELRNGEVHSTSNKAIGLDDSTNINEAGLEELIRTAEDSYNKGEYSYAVEKIWDAFERIKTYYPTLDKKKSAEKIINDISYGNEHIKKMFDNEFKVLTDTGNSYRIRHHEINKIDISKELHYKYFYKRCLALISVIVENLQ
ncbi:TPA: hypothetical protein TUT09_000341 [Streptococcus equi subsp. zooepidemicus]|uniref:AbiJ-related protein n=1 Tax=Streptococcus equi TaxID=1336 RepID=UPI000DA36468|nr:hypothetical protein [Streptococcus equi]MCD3413785.1 hypothetical protein [Streptococcus equi subsp. zooepidemicus]MCD3431259.1 hypothetical protein [Streptococcus equi subsp. zooepidemicus]UFR16239.1 hypothetical protein KVP03_08875 [Streptococcus equi subsp. zooepidemicus]SQG16915.1 Uncharacterised protein [Streptococcus equi subsp. zooepidemicus]HEL0569758.1 hypothetical protein [Streptococcus equi subsp. zooepidemicus]